MVRVVQDDRPEACVNNTLNGYKVTLYDENEVGKNHYQVTKKFEAYFIDLDKLKNFMIEDEGQDPYDNFWDNQDDEELNKEFYRRVKEWDGKTRLVLEGREPDNWGGAVRYVLKPMQWKGKAVWA